MATNNRIVETEQAREMLIRFIEGRKLPFTVTLTDGKHRTTDQNRLQRLWVMEIAAQLGDRTPEEVRGEMKLTFGVPILRAENEAFRARYDEIVKPLPYEAKVEVDDGADQPSDHIPHDHTPEDRVSRRHPPALLQPGRRPH